MALSQAKADREKSCRPLPYTKNFRKLGKLEAGKMFSSSKGSTNWLSSAKGSALKTYIQVKLYELNCCGKIILYTVKVCCYNLFNIEANWPIAE